MKKIKLFKVGNEYFGEGEIPDGNPPRAVYLSYELVPNHVCSITFTHRSGTNDCYDESQPVNIEAFTAVGGTRVTLPERGGDDGAIGLSGSVGCCGGPTGCPSGALGAQGEPGAP